MADHRDRINDEHAKSHAHLKRFYETNPDFSNSDVHALGHDLMTAEQLRDLEASGAYDGDYFRKQAGRDPTPDEIHNKHLEARARGVRGVRSADKLIDHVAGQVEQRLPHVKRRKLPPRNAAGEFTSAVGG